MNIYVKHMCSRCLCKTMWSNLSLSYIHYALFQGGMRVTPEGYGHMTQMLLGLANGKVILTLEVSIMLCTIQYLETGCAGQTFWLFPHFLFAGWLQFDLDFWVYGYVYVSTFRSPMSTTPTIRRLPQVSRFYPLANITRHINVTAVYQSLSLIAIHTLVISLGQTYGHQLTWVDSISGLTNHVSLTQWNDRRDLTFLWYY